MNAVKLTPRDIIGAASIKLMMQSLAWQMVVRHCLFRATDNPDAPAIQFQGLHIYYRPDIVESAGVDGTMRLLDHEFGHFVNSLMEGDQS